MAVQIPNPEDHRAKDREARRAATRNPAAQAPVRAPEVIQAARAVYPAAATASSSEPSCGSRTGDESRTNDSNRRPDRVLGRAGAGHGHRLCSAVRVGVARRDKWAVTSQCSHLPCHARRARWLLPGQPPHQGDVRASVPVAPRRGMGLLLGRVAQGGRLPDDARRRSSRRGAHRRNRTHRRHGAHCRDPCAGHEHVLGRRCVDAQRCERPRPRLVQPLQQRPGDLQLRR